MRWTRTRPTHRHRHTHTHTHTHITHRLLHCCTSCVGICSCVPVLASAPMTALCTRCALPLGCLLLLLLLAVVLLCPEGRGEATSSSRAAGLLLCSVLLPDVPAYTRGTARTQSKFRLHTREVTQYMSHSHASCRRLEDEILCLTFTAGRVSCLALLLGGTPT